MRRLKRRAEKYFHTILPLKWRRQVFGRLLAPLKRRIALLRLPDPPPSLYGALAPTILFPRRTHTNAANDLCVGRFQLLNETRELGRPVDWNPPSPPSLLWTFNLHYFNYIFQLKEAEQIALCRDWTAANPLGKGVGWHPYPTSLRIINWCKIEVQTPDLLRSLYRQASYLYRATETHLLGNHLLENARALVFAGCFFGAQGEAPMWMQRGLALYRKQTPEQVLADGGHFERSPMYHALVLEGYLDVINLLTPSHPGRPFFAQTARRMIDFLASFTHPNGHIALFNDSTQEIALSTETLICYTRELIGYEPAKRSAFPDSGYFVHERDSLYLAVDGGPVGPDYLPAHAHADIFSYELSVNGEPFVVDSGMYDYERGPMRNALRSTAAHNTVCVDNTDQVECWDRFRVARRFAPRNVSFEQSDTGSRFSGCFNGYEVLVGDGIQHQRAIEVDDREQRVVVTDRLEGRGQHMVRSAIHLHPEVEAKRDGDHWRLWRGAARCILRTSGEAILEEGWYCPAFGTRLRNSVVVLGGRLTLPAHLSYEIEIA